MTIQRVLIVDDEPVLRTLMAEILNRNNFQTVGAEDGIDALRILRTDTAFALIVSDVHMPRMDGIDLYRKLRADYPTIPVLVTSVQWKDTRLNTLLQQESVMYLPRPFTAKQFVDKVHNTIANR